MDINGNGDLYGYFFAACWSDLLPEHDFTRQFHWSFVIDSDISHE